MHLIALLTLTICCLSQTFSTPVPPGIPTCPPCEWTEWFNVDHPNKDPNSGDWETLSNITARGFGVCQAPKDIQCRSARFPYVPFKELQYNTTCDKSTGLICLNNKNNMASCIDFEVQFLCCPCDQVANSTELPITETVTSPIPALPTGSTATCYNAKCTWTNWFNTRQPTPGPDGGDFENVTAIINQGYSVCTAPQAAECRLARFPYVPLARLYSTQVCSAAQGLVCLNKNQVQLQCLDYEARFLCCTCEVTTTNSPTTQSSLDDMTIEGSGI